MEDIDVDSLFESLELEEIEIDEYESGEYYFNEKVKGEFRELSIMEIKRKAERRLEKYKRRGY